MTKLRKDSFAARLTPSQRDELFEKLAGGMGHSEAAKLVHDWTKAEWGGRPPSTSAISSWFVSDTHRRNMLAAKESALVAQANCPADIDEQTRRALGQAKFVAVLNASGLTPMDIAFLERAEVAKQKLELDRQKLAQDQRVARRDLRLERDRLIFERIKGGERSENLQQQIDLALDEIEKMKRGEDA